MIKVLAHVPIFNTSVFFVGDCESSKAEEAVCKLKKMKTQVSFSSTAEGCVRDSGGDVYVWVKDLNRASIVAHELGHAACTIMEVCHIPQGRG